MRRMWLAALMTAGSILVPGEAQETTTFTYDPRGRLTNVSRSGGPVSGASTTYNYHPADNRTGVIVSGSPAGSRASGGRATSNMVSSPETSELDLSELAIETESFEEDPSPAETILSTEGPAQ